MVEKGLGVKEISTKKTKRESGSRWVTVTEDSDGAVGPCYVGCSKTSCTHSCRCGTRSSGTTTQPR